MTGIERVRAYYEALNTGDAEAVSSHFTEDAVHYYTRLGPHEGAETIGGFAALGARRSTRSGTSRTRSSRATRS